MVLVNFFSSPIGLGHVTRDIAIENNFQNITTNFVTGSGAAKILKKLEMQVDDVYHPPSFIVENGTLKSPARWLCNIDSNSKAILQGFVILIVIPKPCKMALELLSILQRL